MLLQMNVVQGLVHFVHIFLVKLCLHVFEQKTTKSNTAKFNVLISRAANQRMSGGDSIQLFLDVLSAHLLSGLCCL